MILNSKEGIEDLKDDELIDFCKKRGLYQYELQREQLLFLAKEWLLLSSQKISPSTMIYYSAVNSFSTIPTK